MADRYQLKRKRPRDSRFENYGSPNSHASCVNQANWLRKQGYETTIEPVQERSSGTYSPSRRGSSSSGSNNRSFRESSYEYFGTRGNSTDESSSRDRHQDLEDLEERWAREHERRIREEEERIEAEERAIEREEAERRWRAYIKYREDAGFPLNEYDSYQFGHMPVILKPKAERDADTVFEQLLVKLIVAAILIAMPVAVICAFIWPTEAWVFLKSVAIAIWEFAFWLLPWLWSVLVYSWTNIDTKEGFLTIWTPIALLGWAAIAVQQSYTSIQVGAIDRSIHQFEGDNETIEPIYVNQADPLLKGSKVTFFLMLGLIYLIWAHTEAFRPAFYFFYDNFFVVSTLYVFPIIGLMWTFLWLTVAANLGESLGNFWTQNMLGFTFNIISFLATVAWINYFLGN